jgi:cytochrome c peroxidase
MLENNMEKNYKRIYIPIFVVLLCLMSIFSFVPSVSNPNQKILTTYQQDFAQLKKQASLLEQLTKANFDIKQLHQAYYHLRDAYKKVEYLWEYNDPVYVKEWINGAPLPKLDKSAPQLVIIEPKGLQVLDELLFGDTLNDEELIKIVNELNEAIQDYPEQQKLTDRIIFESMRIALIRLFNLGLTGFDLPASNRALADALIVMITLKQNIEVYNEAITQKDKKLFEKMQNIFAKAEQQLTKQTKFEKFDRLAFLMEVVNPLYQLIVDAQYKLNIESVYETIPVSSKLALNYKATNLFASNFLNPLYYVNLPQKLYNKELIELGKSLFFDPILSASNERSCASCHNPQKGFADGLAKSVATGFNGTVNRNSPTLLNAVYSERFFHDLRAEALEDQMEHVVTSEKEFNSNIIEISGKLWQSSEYVEQFKNCFTEYPNPITQQTIAFAISAYVSSLHSYNSTFDKFVRGESTTLSASAKRGFNLFMGKAACGTCHFAPNFNGTVPPFYNESESEVLGVPENPYASKLNIDPDMGRKGVRLKENADFYKYSFKTPTIRNVELTAPFMHNGAYKNLEDVMDFYNKGGGLGLGLEVPHQTLSSEVLNLSKTEVSDIIAFMKSLTDTIGLTAMPNRLPAFNDSLTWNNRKIGGIY